MLTRVKLNIPIYHGYLILIFCDDIKAASDKYALGLEREYTGAFVYKMREAKTGVGLYYMVFDVKHFMHSTIAHETTHCANWVFQDRQINFDYLNDEPYAYFVGWIAHQVYKYAYLKKIEVITNTL